MENEQLVDKIAEILFKHEEIDCFEVYDSLEALFSRERPNLKSKYENMVRDRELRGRQEMVDSLKTQILQLEKEMQLIKETY